MEYRREVKGRERHRDLYDSLPEGLFHSVGFLNNCSDKDEIIAKIEEQREEGILARRFFSLFEAELEYNSKRIIDWENGYYFIGNREKVKEVFAPLFEILNLLSIEQANRFIAVIPYIHEIRKDIKLVEDALSKILNISISIIEEYKLKRILEMEWEKLGKSKLGESKLGIDTLLKGPFYSGTGSLLIEVKDIEARFVKGYFAGGKERVILEILCEFFLQANKEFEIKIVMEQDEKALCFLGINSYLKLNV